MLYGVHFVVMGRMATKDILLNLLKCLAVFYGVYYVVGSLCFAGFKLKVFDGKIPFDFQSWIDLTLCCVRYTNEQIVNLISMLTSFSICGFIYGLIVPNWIWDYAVTITLIHIGLCCLVMLNFPLSWSWWVCLACSLLLEIGFGEVINYIKRQKSQVKVAVLSEQDPSNYLYLKT